MPPRFFVISSVGRQLAVAKIETTNTTENTEFIFIQLIDMKGHSILALSVVMQFIVYVTINYGVILKIK